MAVASLLGGMLTLVGTPPNLVVSNLLTERGREPFDLFDFTPVGAVMVTLGVVFMVLVGRRLLPDRTPAPGREGGGGLSGSELAGRYRLASLLLGIPAGSPLVGRSLRQLGLPERFGATVTAIETSLPDDRGEGRPLAWGLAEAAGVAPEPILMTVAVAASTAFATPMASPVNTLVLGPGGYRFGDFFRIGALLQSWWTSTLDSSSS